VKCIFALILVLIIFKHPKYRIRKIVLVCVLGMVGGCVLGMVGGCVLGMVGGR